jgi:glyoxylase-like metal-dependent hydrolase (beta-lactamase superfamily II)
MTLEIHPLHVGTLRDYPTAGILFQRGFQHTHDVAMIMFVILGGEKPIVVDTGTGTEEFTRTHHGFDLVRPPEQEPAAALARLGVDPADVEIVVNTHLHWDHCSNNALFPNAAVHVQRDELAYAIAPLESNRVAFDNTAVLTPPWLAGLGRIVPVDGDTQLAPGVRLVHLPGHTPGSQGVLVDSGDKQFLLCGDFIDSYANWEGDEKVSHIPSGSFIDLKQYWASFRRVEELGCEVVPSHDLRVIEHGVFRG